MDDISEKEVLVEIYSEIKAIKQLLYWPFYLLIAFCVLNVVLFFTS